MREAQRAAGLKPRYDGRWRDSQATPPTGVQPVVRFKTPLDGEVVFDDLVKGCISVQNSELDDLVIMRGDGTPTYNFGVVVDDWDMAISHVIRGDDHVNNTPRQINILKALGAPLPRYAHVPMILGTDGERLSKRHGAVSVMQYREDGYLPEALLNYLARLGWAHGDEEVFSTQQFVEWFDVKNVSRSPAKFNGEKLHWISQQYLKSADDNRLAELALPFIQANGCDPTHGPELAKVAALLKERVGTIEELADAAVYFYRPLEPTAEIKQQYLTDDVKPALAQLTGQFSEIDWNRQAIHDTLKNIATTHDLKMGKIAMPLRVMVTGETQTPSINATLELMGRDEVLRRMQHQLQQWGK